MKKKNIFVILVTFILIPYVSIKANEWNQYASSFVLDTTMAKIQEQGNKYAPSIASIDSSYFVVWEKDLNSGYNEIRGTRVFRNGDIEYKDGIFIADSAKGPKVVSMGNKYFVFYYKNQNLYMRSVKINNFINYYELSDEHNLNICPVFSYPFKLQYNVCKNGNNFGVFYDSSLIGKFIIIDSLGNSVNSAESICHSYNNNLASDGENYFLVWGDMTDGIWAGKYPVYGERLSNNGNIIDSMPIEISGGRFTGLDPSLGVDYRGDKYTVIWIDTTYNIYGNIITKDGVVQDSAGFFIAQYPGKKKDPLLSFNGQDYLVVYNIDDFYKACRGTRFTTSGIVIDTPGFHITRMLNSDMNMYLNQDGGLLCWSNKDGSLSEIHALRLSSEGIPIDTSDILLTDIDSIYTTNYDQYKPSAAYSPNSGRYLVLWNDDRNTSSWKPEIYGIFIDTLGNKSNAFLISNLSYNCTPKVTYGRDRWFVTWSHGNSIYGALVLEDGTVFPPNGKQLEYLTNVFYHDMVNASIGNRFICVYSCTDDPPSNCGSLNYRVIDSALNIINGTNLEVAANYPSFTGINVYNSDSIFITTYGACYPNGSGGNENGIYMRKIDYNGYIIDSLIELKSPYKTVSKSICRDNKLFLIWGNTDLWGTIYDTLGNVLTDSIIISNANGEQIIPTLAYSNQKFVAMWEDHRNNSKGNIFEATIDMEGTILDSGAITAGDSAHITPNLVEGPDSQLFLTYSGWTDSINGVAVNHMRIWGKFNKTTITDTIDTTVIDTINNSNRTVNLVSGLCSDFVFSNFNNLIIFKYYIASRVNVHLNIYNISGSQVYEYDNYSNQNIGDNEIKVNFSNLPSGLYLYKFKAGTLSKNGKMIILR